MNNDSLHSIITPPPKTFTLESAPALIDLLSFSDNAHMLPNATPLPTTLVIDWPPMPNPVLSTVPHLSNAPESLPKSPVPVLSPLLPHQDSTASNELNSNRFLLYNYYEAFEIWLDERDYCPPKKQTNSTPASALAYKKVANHIKPVATTLPEEYWIVRHIPQDPLTDLPALPTQPPEFTPGK